MEEAIGLRDDGLELCARVAKQQEMTGPSWPLLAIWWFWVQASVFWVINPLPLILDTPNIP